MIAVCSFIRSSALSHFLDDFVDQAIDIRSQIYIARQDNLRRPGFEPGLPDWQSDVLDQTGRPSQLFFTIQKSLFKVWAGSRQ